MTTTSRNSAEGWSDYGTCAIKICCECGDDGILKGVENGLGIWTDGLVYFILFLFFMRYLQK